MNRRNKGSMLIELITIVSATSAMLIVTIGLIHQSLRWSKEFQHRNTVLRTNSSLARSFRHDTHLSTSVTVQDMSVRMTTPTSTIRYQWSDGELSRIIEGTDSNGSKEQPSETFRYGSDYSANFLWDEPLKTCSLLITKTGPVHTQPIPIVTVKARPREIAIGGLER